ncbi:type IV secretion system protein VirB10 [Bartonella henselae]|uniref:type IV secretion system protein VirB10 n=1 Tax=Bartonella henselae TaxID=38323 RepID=UPI0003DF9C38|nr:type IV secretion system protein VirB10 [Bartonella henselae]ETS06089.1 type IV secretion system protein virB10 [Bartonella henselae JK 42]ETS11109.1 type IV secretion system protein virB10 [Bartonella henselae JK 41]KEC56212.1 type IV secretion system protein virB10 [Bartonella henselae str. Zeus]KEC58920.1 type IV secretion system protein virB10 [Bartonella henselae JK 53]MDM9983356.1 type IV secretion system protein VirB10 [Bartonella henselae]
MNDPMDENNLLNDRDMIKDGQGKKQRPNTSKAAALVILFGVCLYLAYSTLFTEKQQPVEVQKEGIIKQTELFRPAPPKPVSLEPTIEKNNVLLPKVELPTPPKKTTNSDDSLLEAAQRAPVLAYANTQKGQGSTEKNKDISANQPEAKPDETAQRFNHLLKPTTLEGIRAAKLGNRNYIIAMGASIPCILETAISSDQQGFASCIVSRDILSDNGRVVLLDKGTQIVGEYRAGLKKGQKRLFVLWNRAKTPNGIIITLASPATDALGRSGMDGDIDNHWLERIGSALLVSIVKDATNYVKGRLPKDQDKNNSETISSGQNIANIAVENYANIPPTLSKNQGEMVNVFVARDLDFSNVYKLKVIENKKQIVNRALSRNFYKNSAVILQ